MNIIPWRRGESSMPASLEDMWNQIWGNGEGEQVSHLPAVFQRGSFPAVNVAETESSFSITVDCPGLDEKEIEVEAMGNTLVISGERKWEEEKKGKEFRRVESQFGRFERRVQLPPNAIADAGKIEARYKKGVLTVTVPKVEKTPSAKIPVKG